MARVLITGPPGIGKTTLTLRVVDVLRAGGVPLAGFTTSEIRRGGRRTGFTITGLESGLERTLAVRNGRGPRVGTYAVDVRAFEDVAIVELENGIELGSTLIVDEIGKMELLSERFRELLPYVLYAPHVLATVHAHRHPLTDALKRRKDVRLVHLGRENREELVQRVADLVLAPDFASRSSRR